MSRCKHDVDGTDCFKCFPNKPKEFWIPVVIKDGKIREVGQVSDEAPDFTKQLRIKDETILHVREVTPQEEAALKEAKELLNKALYAGAMNLREINIFQDQAFEWLEKYDVNPEGS